MLLWPALRERERESKRERESTLSSFRCPTVLPVPTGTRRIVVPVVEDSALSGTHPRPEAGGGTPEARVRGAWVGTGFQLKFENLCFTGSAF